MTARRILPARETSISFKVANSTFNTTAAPAFSVDEAKEFIHRIRDQHPNATHNVPLYIIGHPPSVIEHSSDDGEPAGTAGRPALAVLRGSGFGDIVVVITRYFGGTKLGTGGLVKAYSDSMRELLAALPRAEKISTTTTQFTVPYPLYSQIQRTIDIHNGEILRQDFKLDVSLEIRFRSDGFEQFQDEVLTITNGGIIVSPSEIDPDDIFPIKE